MRLKCSSQVDIIIAFARRTALPQKENAASSAAARYCNCWFWLTTALTQSVDGEWVARRRRTRRGGRRSCKPWRPSMETSSHLVRSACVNQIQQQGKAIWPVLYYHCHFASSRTGVQTHNFNRDTPLKVILLLLPESQFILSL